MNLEFDPKYFNGLSSHSTDYLSYGDVLVFVSPVNLWACVLHGVLSTDNLDDLRRRGYQVVWGRESMLNMQPCTVNVMYVGQRVVEFGYYAVI